MRHPSAAALALRAHTARYRAPSVAIAAWQLASSFGGFIAVCAIMYATLGIGYGLTLALGVIAAGFLVRIFIVQHDCGHGSFLGSRRANDIVGHLCSGLTFTPYRIWRRQHAGHHANWNNLDHRASGADMYSTCLTTDEYRGLPLGRRLLYRFTRAPLVSLVLIPPIVFLLLYRVPFDTPRDWKRERRGVWWTNLGIAAGIVALGLVLGFRNVALVQLPVIVFGAIIGVWLFSVQHRYERALWTRQEHWNATDAALRGSSYLRLPRALQWFTGNIGFHHVHHLDPRIPNYRLEGCHKAHPALRQIPRMSLWDGLTAFRYKLWDEAQQRFVRIPIADPR